MTRTRTTRYVTLLSVVLAQALTVALAACGSDEPSGVTGPDRTASTPGSGVAPTATDTPAPADATAPPAASRSAETDREALVALYNATDGENWRTSDNWLSDAPLDDWYGVATDDDGRVKELGLEFENLSGEIPPELGSLSNLVGLALSGNELSGCVPSRWEECSSWIASLGEAELRLPACFRMKRTKERTEMSSEKPIRVMVVEYHPIVRNGLRDLLERSGRIDVVGLTADGEEAVRTAKELKPGVIVMDVIMPGKDGIDACREIIELLPGTRVLMLTASTEEDAVIGAVAAGATGYIQKHSRPEELVEAVLDVAEGRLLIPEKAVREVFENCEKSDRLSQVQEVN